MPNRLASEKSPYLLQHADNPVDWYAWGDDAFEAARERDVPVFLSVGYATCHWCHVMAHESFEDEKVARVLNEHFVCIKVDREERPDVDAVYMRVCQMMTGHGGWPLTVLLTPDREPFYAATYLPPSARGRRIGLRELAGRVGTLWKEDRDRLLEPVPRVIERLQQTDEEIGGKGTANEEWLDRTAQHLRQQFDPEYGGFGSAPKFPTPHHLQFLAHYLARTRSEAREDLEHVLSHTLRQMRSGGIWDHVGGGFHRYSTDERWHLPHFEKMLYDQAFLCLAYLEAYRSTGHRLFRETARGILDYVQRDLASEDGLFFAAEDADSEGREGAFYVWTEEELEEVLGVDAATIGELFGFDPKGNFRDEATGQRTGENLLDRTESLPLDGAEREDVREQLERLREVRERRERPLRDEKVLVDWNGHMIRAFARAGELLDDDELIAAARRAFDRLVDVAVVDGRLMHRVADGEAKVYGMLDDYAGLALAALDLHAATGNPRYLERARTLASQMVELFGEEEGPFYQSSADAGTPITRMRPVSDEAMPSGNALAATALVRLADLTGETDLAERARSVVGAVDALMERYPSSVSGMMEAADWLVGPTRQILLFGSEGDPDAEALLAATRPLPPRTVRVLVRPSDRAAIEELVPWISSYPAPDEGAVAYVCRDYTCDAPTSDPQVLATQLEMGAP